MAAHCGQLVQVQDECDGRFSRPGSSSSCGDGSDDGWTRIPPMEDPPPCYLDAVSHPHLANRGQHHRCSRLQPQSQLKYQSKDSSTVIESMKDEVMRNFIRPPPNRIVVCCDCPCMCSPCRHHLPHHPTINHPNISPSTISPSNINPSTISPSSSPRSSTVTGSSGNRSECGTKRKSTDRGRSEPDSTRSFSFSHHFLLPSGFRIKSLRSKNIMSGKSSIKDDGGRSRKSNINNNDTAASFSSSSNKSIYSYFQSSLIPTIFVSSSKSSSS